MGSSLSWLWRHMRLLMVFVVLHCLLLSIPQVRGASEEDDEDAENSEETEKDDGKCEPGLLLPVWLPQDDLSTGDRFARGLAYFLAMIYMFIGVSIISDRFMASIEVITSKEKEIKVKRPNGETQIVVVRVWNETVANLTLMALGSSAPEILLSIIEMFQKKFESGDLGPGTIVGSAAFNLLVIIAICVYVIPDGEVRKIKHLRVFAVTATWSVFAYLWLLVILKVFSPGVVELWEGVVTFLFFPATVITAYIADRRLLIYKYLSKQYRINKRGMIVEAEGGGAEMEKMNEGGLRVFDEEGADEGVREFEESRRDYIRILRELRKKHPNIDAEHLEAMAREEILNKGPKSRAFYRMQATRKLMGGQNLMKKIQEKAASENTPEAVVEKVVEKRDDDHITRIFFDPGHYTVLENVGEFFVTVGREGGDLNATVHVDYKTEDGTASGDADYKAAAGTITFGPGETQKQITLEVIDDDVFEEDEHFYVRLSNARFADGFQANGAAGRFPKPPEVKLTTPFLATVIILDDDHCGIFNLGVKDVETVESVGVYDLKVVRWSGARGRVCVPYETEEGTAKPGKDYVHVEDELIFENNETEKFISIQILEEDSYEKDVLFYVNLKTPRLIEDSPDKQGTIHEIIIHPMCVMTSSVDPLPGSSTSRAVSYSMVDNSSKPSSSQPHHQNNSTATATTATTSTTTVVIEAGNELNEADSNNTSSPSPSSVVGESPNEDNVDDDIPVEFDEENPDRPFESAKNLSKRRKSKKKSTKRENKSTKGGRHSSVKFESIHTDEGAAMALLSKDKAQLDEDEKIAIEGLPKLGPDDRTLIRVKESKEFKNTVDKLVQRANASLLVGTSSWKEQFIEAISVSAGDDDDGGDEEEGGEGGEEKVPSCGDYVMHFLTIFWKIIFAFVPPTDIAGGYVAFVVSILGIGVLTAVIGDLASHLGCSIGLKDSVTAIGFVALGTSIPGIADGYVTFVVSILGIGCLTALIGDMASHLGCTVGLKDAVTAIAFVALGTSVPDTFASKVAAIQDEYADASVGNVTGSNAVNVFLGIGIAWTMASIYHKFLKPHDPSCVDKPMRLCREFNVDPGSLAYSVTVFCSVALVAIAVMVLRRHKSIGGELGGPRKAKIITSAFFFTLWMFYVLMSSLEAYGFVQGF